MWMWLATTDRDGSDCKQKNICTARDLNDTWSRSSVALTDNISVSMRAVTNAGAMEGN